MIITGLRKKLGDFSLSVDNLVIRNPGVYGLVGPNGSGKSTLAKLMAGLLDSDAGFIDTEGLNSGDITMIGRKPYMMNDTVYNNLIFPLKLRKLYFDRELLELIDHYIEIMGFSGKKKQKAKSLSGGEQQKLAFLRALIFKPRLIIADEALTALDIDSLDFFENMIMDEQKNDQKIFIIISHQISHLRRLASHVFFMYRGNVEAEGSMEEILREPANPHLRQYLRVYGEGK